MCMRCQRRIIYKKNAKVFPAGGSFLRFIPAVKVLQEMKMVRMAKIPQPLIIYLLIYISRLPSSEGAIVNLVFNWKT